MQMVKAFLPGMIRRKRGRIVAVASVAAKVTGGLASIYCSTKYGLDGFMEALFDELCMDDLEEFIKLTTVYPFFINTRKELADALDKAGNPHVSRMRPQTVAEQTVKGVLLNKRKVYILPNIFTLIIQ